MPPLMVAVVVVAVLVVAFIIRAKTSKPKRLSSDGFTALFTAAFREAAPESSITSSKPLSLTVKHHDEEAHVALDNAYQLYQTDPDSLNSIVGSFLASMLDLDGGEMNPDLILPAIKPSDWVDAIREQINPSSHGDNADSRGPVFDPWLEGMVVAYAENSANNVFFITGEALEESTFSLDELRSRALDNLRNMVQGNITREKRFQGGPIQRMTSADPVWDASLLLLDELWDAETLGITKEIVVALPARDLLLVADSGKPEQIDMLRQGAANAFDMTPYSITRRLLVRRQNKWEMLD